VNDFFYGNGVLSSELCTCRADALPLKPCFQTIFTLVVFGDGVLIAGVNHLHLGVVTDFKNVITGRIFQLLKVHIMSLSFIF
jgi:hypothetical protein